MSSDGGKILTYSFGGLCLGIYLFFSAFAKMKEKKLIENTPTSKVRSLAMGHVEVYGEVILNKNELIKAPFSGTACAYCRWTVEEYVQSKNGGHWRTIKSGIMDKYFYLKDNTGIVLVDPRNANVDIPYDFQKQTNKFSQEELSKFSIEGVPYKTLFGFNKNLRLTEYYLAKGDKIYIMGYAGDNPFVEDGSSDKNETDIMIQKGRKEQFFYISDKPEKEILAKYTWKVIGGFFGGAGLIVVCLFIIFAYLGIL